MKPTYAVFYLEGRDANLIRADIDTEAVAKDAIDGKGTIHELLLAAATSAAQPLRVDRKKRQWCDDFEDEIKTAGGDANTAYDHFLQGRIDELVARLETEVVEDMGNLVGEDDLEEGDEPEDGDDDDDGEEDDEDEGEDDETDDADEDDAAK